MNPIKQEDGYLLFEGVKLDPIVKQTWLEALRSDEYPQGIGQFITYDDNVRDVIRGYCCLGVCAVVLNKDKEDIVRRIGSTCMLSSGRKVDYTFPEELRTKTDYEDVSLAAYLAALNDGSEFTYKYNKELGNEKVNEKKKKYSFEEIADYINKYL